jgi:uncharacterized membrane protein YjjP (DUF1212 family)
MASRRERDPDDAVEFVVQLGAAMVAALSPVTTVRERIEVVASSYALDLEFFVLPTSVWAVGFEERTIISLAATDPGTFRFDQTGALYALVERAATGAVRPDDGLRELEEIRSRPPRYPWWVAIVGVVLIGVGISLVLEGRGRDVLYAAALGGVAGVLRAFAPGRPSYDSVLPAIAAFVIGASVFAMHDAGWVDEPLRVITPALVVFLPGSMLTIGAIELAAGSLASGSARLVSGFYTLLLLTFGLIVAGSALGLTTADEIAEPQVSGLGWWALAIGPGIYVVGVGLAFSAPRRSWVALLSVVYSAWAVQLASVPAVGSYVSALLGAAAGVVVASIARRWFDGPPPLVSFTPAFWLLVPGGLSLVAVARATAGTTGGGQLGPALMTIVAIAIGVVLGLGVVDAILRRASRD